MRPAFAGHGAQPLRPVAVNGLTDPNASLLDKAFYTVAGAGALIPSLLEAPVTGLYNFANNASMPDSRLRPQTCRQTPATPQ